MTVAGSAFAAPGDAGHHGSTSPRLTPAPLTRVFHDADGIHARLANGEEFTLNPLPEAVRRDVEQNVARIRRQQEAATTSASTSVSATSAATATPASATTTAYDATYYKNAVGKTGTALKSSLHTIISANVSKISYSAVWDALKVTDQDPNNSSNVLLLYSGVSRSKSLNGGDVGDWNREHTWAKSHGDFGEAIGPGTDLHHLRACDVQVNSIRGNLDFDNGGSSVTNGGGSTVDGGGGVGGGGGGAGAAGGVASPACDTVAARILASSPSDRSGWRRYSVSVTTRPSTVSPRNSRRSLVGMPPFSWANDRCVSARTRSSGSSWTPSFSSRPVAGAAGATRLSLRARCAAPRRTGGPCRCRTSGTPRATACRPCTAGRW